MRSHGYSLLECLCVLALLAVVMYVTFTHVYPMLLKVREWTTVYRLFDTLQWARAEAMRQHQRIIFCASADHQTCCDNWQQGQLVGIVNASAATHTSTPTSVLRILPAVAGQLHFHGFTQNQAVYFSAAGTRAENGTFTYTVNETLCWQIIINTAGRARLQQCTLAS